MTVVLLLASPLHASEHEGIHAGLRLFSGEKLFNKLPEVAQQGRRYFCMIAFLILVGSAISYYNNSKGAEAIIRHSLLAMSIGITITFIPQILNWSDKFTHAMTESLGDYETKQCINKIFQTSTLLANVENPINTAPDAKTKFTLTSALGEIKIWFLNILKNCTRWLMIQALSGWLWVCSVICSIIDTVRYFLVYMGSMILPVFLAGLTTNTFRNQSVNFIYGLLGIICWPIGWAIGHMGTASLFAFSMDIIKCSTRIGELEPTSKIETDKFVVCAAAISKILTISQIATFLTFVLMLMFIGFWMILVSLSAPYLIQKVIVSGGQFFSGLVSSTAQTTMGTAGNAGASAFSAANSFISKKMGNSSQAPNSITASNSNPNSGISSINNIKKGGMMGSFTKASAQALCMMGYGASRIVSKMSKFDGNPSQFMDVISKSRPNYPKGMA